MTTNPYAPPVPPTEPTPDKRPFIQSGSRILLVAFVEATFIPFFGNLLAGYVVSSGSSGLGADVELFQWVTMALTVVVSVLMSVVPIGTWMLAHEPRNCVEKAPAWLRWGAVGSAAAYVVFLWVGNIYLFFDSQAPTHDAWAILDHAAVVSHHLAMVMLVVLVRHLASLLGELGTRRLADVNLVLRVVLVGWFVILDFHDRHDNSMGMLVTAALSLTGNGVLFALLWFARRFESGHDVWRTKQASRR